MTPSLDALRQTCAVLRLQPFDTATPEGRSKERYRRAFLATLASGLSKCISVGATLISVPLTLHYLGTERYGLWMTISSVIAVLGFSDLGINNGLLNAISRAHGEGDRELARQYVSSAFFFLSAVTLTLGLAFAAAYRWIPWGQVFRVQSPEALSETGPAVACFVGCFLLTIPGGIVNRVQVGYQDGLSANLGRPLGAYCA